MGILKNKILLLILLFIIFTRLYHIDYPNSFVFDEVYHGFTAKEYLKASKQAWDPFATPPKGVAFEWTHPPMAKEIMASSMFLVGSQDAWVWRLPEALLGILSVYLVYLLGLTIFKNPTAALISGFIFSIDGLNFVQSRTGMNDIYFVTFTLASLLFILKKRFVFAAILFGLSLSSKWAAIYLLPIYAFFIVKNRRFRDVLYFLIFIPLIYLLTYSPYFLLGYDFNQFIELQKQMWWYHTGLKATHDYASPWWSWPLNLYPVWYFVDYQGEKIANIFASGNPLVFWFGSVAVLITLWEIIKGFTLQVLRQTQDKLSREVSKKLLIILSGFFIFWLPWVFSPRIMFLYHFAPSVPFLSLALGYQLSKLSNTKTNRKILFAILGLMFLSFLALFPFLTGIPLPKEWVKFFFLTNLAKNPF